MTLARILIVPGGGFTSKEAALGRLLENRGHTVKFVGKTRGLETSREGEEIMPDIALYETNPDYFDFAVIIGEEMKEVARPEIIRTIRKCVFEKKGAAGINKGPVLLAFAGVLNGKRAAVAFSEKSIKFLKDSGAKYAQEEIVTDGNVVTAAHPEATEDIAAAILKIL